jgi:two-component system phosphate regulon response regulator PhoB
MSRARVLIIEDDAEIQELLSLALAREGWELVAAKDGEAGLAALGTEQVDCVILDIMLPGMDGLEVLRRLKASQSARRIPVIMTTARGEEADIVSGLELGADDYVVKPYSPKVLAARIRAALRRVAEAGTAGGADADVVTRGGLRVDRARHEVLLAGGAIELSATEFDILDLLCRNPGRVFSRSQIIDAVRGHDYPVTDRSVDVQILSLRRKLGTGGELIETVRGVGYRLRD